MNYIKFKLQQFIFILILIASGNIFSAAGSYIQVYQGIANGGLTFTGNTLGLSGTQNPGVQDGAGAYITTDLTKQYNTYPPGTTFLYSESISTAVLDLPANSTILYAELIWGGSYGFDGLPLNTCFNTSVNFITPDNVTHVIAPRAATKQSEPVSNGGFYVCSQDVTSILQGLATPTGTYQTGGVPGTKSYTSIPNYSSNCSGWTLAVAYSNPNMKTSELALYTAGVLTTGSSDPIVLVTGFVAPSSGTISARIFVSSLEGDANRTQDTLKIGTSSPPTTSLSGTNNPVNNFFASQINTLLSYTTEVSSGKIVATGSGQLDTRGTFGTRNQNAAAGTNISAGRQGYDITSIDISSYITPGQSQLYVQGTTGPANILNPPDQYMINGLGLQLQTDGPIIQSTKSANVASAGIGNIITYTLTFQNTGAAAASNLSLVDVLPSGLSFVAGSFKLNGVAQPGVTYTQLSTTGVAIGNPSPTLPVGATTTVQFQAQVVSTSPNPQPSSYTNFGTVTYSYSPFGTPITLTSQTNSVVVTNSGVVTPPVANNDTAITNANTTLNQNASVLLNDTGTGTLSINTYSTPTTKGGTVSMITNGASAGTYTYIPPSNYSGTGVNADTFTYNIIDSTLLVSNSATVTITVLPVANPDSATVAANTTLVQNTSVLNNDIGTGLVVSAYDVVSDQGGTVSMLPNGTYTYTPLTGFSGADFFNYTAQDTSGQTATAQVLITVLPVAPPGTGTTPANQPYNGTTNPISPGLTIISYDNPSAQGGTVSMTTSGANVGNFTYTPPLNYSGLDTFNYTLSDLSTGTVTMTVTPVGVNDTGSTNANTPLVQGISVLSNDLGSGLSIIPASMNLSSIQGGTIIMLSNGTYTYTPPNNFSGVDTFTYTGQDSPLGNLYQATVTITVFPSANNDAATTFANTALTNAPSVLANDSGSLQIISYQNPTTGGGSVTMNADGTYIYLPPLGVSGTDTFNYTASDSQGHTVTGTVTITILPLVHPATGTTFMDTPLNSDVNLAGDVGTGISVVPFTGASNQGGTVTINSNGTYTYVPPLGFVGVDLFNFTVIDAFGNSVNSTVTITVTPVIQPPTNFNGCVKTLKFFNRTETYITLTWNPSPTPDVAYYNIYLDGKLVATVPAGSPLVYNLCLKSKKQASHIQITAVDSNGNESTLVNVNLQC